MGLEPKFNAISACLGNVGDRFLTSGYKERAGLEDRLKRIAGIEKIAGMELFLVREIDYWENAERATEESVAILVACDRWVKKSARKRYIHLFVPETLRKCSG